MNKLRDALEKLGRFIRTVLVFLITETLTNTIVSVISQYSTVQISGTLSEMQLNWGVAALFAILFWGWDGSQKSLRNLTEKFELLEKKNAEAFKQGVVDITNALLGNSAARLYADLPGRVSDPLITGYVGTLTVDDRLETRALAVSQEFLQLISKDNRWYPILSRFLRGIYAGLRDGRFSLSLESYLTVYLDLIEHYIARAKRDGNQLHIWSFTNAIPTDWFAGDASVAGNIGTDFSNKKARLINEMREAKFVMRMVTLALEHPSAALPDIRTTEDVRRAWINMPEDMRGKYLARLHTADSEALVASLGIEGLQFFSGMVEFIYFGFGVEGNIAWDLCIVGGYSSRNQVLPAQYIFLGNENRNRLLVDIPNSGNLRPSEAMAANTRLQISFDDWPGFVVREHGYGAIRMEAYEGMLSFAEKWRLAADIWHTDEESKQVEALLDDVLNGKNEVLDAAAGTGFHCGILKRLGKDVSALEVSPDELRILQEGPLGSHVTLVAGDWRTLGHDLGGRTFDAIVCLGSSIPYHSSWNDSRAHNAPPKASSLGAVNPSEKDATLARVIENFRKALRPGGVLVVGLSRHNERSRTGVSVEYNKEIDNVKYQMKWNFTYNWTARTRLWNVNIAGDGGKQYSFEVMGHLFDHKDLSDICAAHFQAVEIREIDTSHYDKYLVCRV